MIELRPQAMSEVQQTYMNNGFQFPVPGAPTNLSVGDGNIPTVRWNPPSCSASAVEKYSLSLTWCHESSCDHKTSYVIPVTEACIASEDNTIARCNYTVNTTGLETDTIYSVSIKVKFTSYILRTVASTEVCDSSKYCTLSQFIDYDQSPDL